MWSERVGAWGGWGLGEGSNRSAPSPSILHACLCLLAHRYNPFHHTSTPVCGRGNSLTPHVFLLLFLCLFPCLQVASYGAPSGSLAAVATVSGLFAVDFARSMGAGTGGALVLHAVNGSGQPLTTYNDIKWDTQKGRLFAANGEPGKGRIDVLEVRPIAQPA